MKYGRLSPFYEEQTIFHGGLLDYNYENFSDMPYRMNNSSGDAFPEYCEFPVGESILGLRMLIGFQYYGPSALLFGLAHEIGHYLGAGREGIKFSERGMINFNSILNPASFQTAYETVKRSKMTSNEFDSMFGEQIADFISVLAVEAYIKTIPRWNDQINAVYFAMASVCDSGNRIDSGHPPLSLRRNIFLVSKYINTLLTLDKNNTLPTMPKYMLNKVKGLPTSGGTRRKRKSTYRCRR